jgi:signal peptidase I
MIVIKEWIASHQQLVRVGMLLAVVVLLPLVIRTFVLQPCKTPVGAMEKTLRPGDYFLINKFIYGRTIPFTDIRLLPVRMPRRGDVVVFAFPGDTSKLFVSRIIGVPGDQVEVLDKKVQLNGAADEHSYELHLEKDLIPANQNPRDNLGPITVPENAYFVMGDSRDRAYDSRFWGVLKSRHIMGQAFMTYWSWDKETRRVRRERIGAIID